MSLTEDVCHILRIILVYYLYFSPYQCVMADMCSISRQSFQWCFRKSIVALLCIIMIVVKMEVIDSKTNDSLVPWQTIVFVYRDPGLIFSLSLILSSVSAVEFPATTTVWINKTKLILDMFNMPWKKQVSWHPSKIYSRLLHQKKKREEIGMLFIRRYGGELL